MLTPDDLTNARSRLLRMHHASGVGHIGGNLSALDAMMLVHHEFMGPNDRFVLSKGHAAGALYVTLWSRGQLTDADLDTFHKDDTLLAGHPPANGLEAIPFATGSLGHGLSLAAGTALAMKLQQRPGMVFCLMSDGEWQEGSTWEALIFARHQGLDNLTVLVDHNGLQGFGTTAEVASMAPLWERLRGFDPAIAVVDGHDLAAMRSVLSQSGGGMRIVMLRTTKGHGVAFMENKMEWHYLPLDADKHASAQAGVRQDDRTP
ncbi:MAG TPA: 1-deoxy-D-xylulose-5-phosphate synthase N-terminal domain-containing protein [Ramlibacter sp.]|nr:1-deoxy-D-xylulose-5-phosphate synthase N-terminal domain-containing protein [Ramlibacter sp.]